ncbi:MAG: sulfurtransferase TusA family protein [Acidimicrobiia bacterium]|nr:sulfurtransferase TusA family protein [Acidimicrobiia bacterium]MDH3462165.1 sulfurtransferase TusA family protein [Acidimicrobiia bacterium]
MTDTRHDEHQIVDLEATELDCAGLLCPLPVYKAALVLNNLADGEHLRLITTDPGALRDIPAMARQRGDTLLEVNETEGRQTFLIQKGQ